MKKSDALKAIEGEKIREGVREYTSLKDLPQFCKNREVVLKATILNGSYEFKFADEALKDDEEFIIQVLSNATYLNTGISEGLFEPQILVSICKKVNKILLENSEEVNQSLYLQDVKHSINNTLSRRGYVESIKHIEDIMKIYNGKTLHEVRELNADFETTDLRKIKVKNSIYYKLRKLKNRVCKKETNKEFEPYGCYEEYELD